MRHFATAVLTCALMLMGTTANAQFGNRSRNPYGDHGFGGNGLIQSVQEHLRRAASFGRPRGKEYDRFNNAMRHLSEFDAKLNRGQFDRGKLDRAIEDVHNVVNHNRLERRDRDMLATDLNRLREFRSRAHY